MRWRSPAAAAGNSAAVAQYCKDKDHKKCEKKKQHKKLVHKCPKDKYYDKHKRACKQEKKEIKRCHKKHGKKYCKKYAGPINRASHGDQHRASSWDHPSTSITATSCNRHERD